MLKHIRRRGNVFLHVLLAATIMGLVLQFAGSKSTAPEKARVITLTVSPSSGAPGTLIMISGFQAGGIPPNAVVEIGGAPAPLVIRDDGKIGSAIPLYINGSGQMVLPVGAQDLVVKQGEAVLGQALQAVTVSPLPEPGAAAGQMLATLGLLASSMREIVDGCVPTPGVQGQYAYSVAAAMDSLLHGSGDNSISSVMSRIEDDTLQARIADYVIASSGILDRAQQLSQYLQSIQDDMQMSSSRRVARGRAHADRAVAVAASAAEVDDQRLARMMEFHSIAKQMGEAEIAIGGQTYVNTLVAMSALCSGADIDPSTLSLDFALILFFDKLMNEMMLGTLPANLDGIDLTVKYNTIAAGDTTEATAVVRASNAGSSTSLSATVDQILQGLGGLQSSSVGQALYNCLSSATQIVSTNLQAAVASYAAQYPELQLNSNLQSPVPAMQWKATASTSALYFWRTADPAVLIPCSNEINWYAPLSADGRAGVFVEPSDLSVAHLLAAPPGISYYGAFGDNVTGSNLVMVTVTTSAILNIGASITPSPIPEGQSALLTVHATYHSAGGTINAENVSLSLSTYRCTVGEANGYTDGAGMFATAVTPSQGADSVCVYVEGSGAGGTSASGTACAKADQPVPDSLRTCDGHYMYFLAPDPYGTHPIRAWVFRYAFYGPPPNNLANVSLFRDVTNWNPATHQFDYGYAEAGQGTGTGSAMDFTCDPNYPLVYAGTATITMAESEDCECSVVLRQANPSSPPVSQGGRDEGGRL